MTEATFAGLAVGPEETAEENMRMAVATGEGTVDLVFENEVRHVGFAPEQAMRLALALAILANDLKPDLLDRFAASGEAQQIEKILRTKP